DRPEQADSAGYVPGLAPEGQGTASSGHEGRARARAAPPLAPRPWLPRRETGGGPRSGLPGAAAQGPGGDRPDQLRNTPPRLRRGHGRRGEGRDRGGEAQGPRYMNRHRESTPAS